MLQDTARSLSPLERTSSSVSSQTKASSCSNITEDSTCCSQTSGDSPAQEKGRRQHGSGFTSRKRNIPNLQEDRIPPYPFPADFELPFGQDERVNVISQLCDSPGGPSTIAVLLPGVHGGVGPCREPGSNFDENCLYAMVAQRLQELGRAVDVYRCSWQFMCPTMTYSLNAVCHVLQHALKQAQRRGSHAINVVIVGHSLGGQVALHSAAMLARLKEESHLFLEKGESSMEVTGFCTLNAAADLKRWEASEELRRVLSPLKALLVSGDADEVVPPVCTRELHEALHCANKRHLDLPGGTHDLFQYKDFLVDTVSQFIIECSPA
ncbi:unnamed protein product [Symbiodinium sp. CCMP2592]|nr:unnamed protein product [Symbiodinium sp. CCMP2592]